MHTYICTVHLQGGFLSTVYRLWSATVTTCKESVLLRLCTGISVFLYLCTKSICQFSLKLPPVVNIVLYYFLLVLQKVNLTTHPYIPVHTYVQRWPTAVVLYYHLQTVSTVLLFVPTTVLHVLCGCVCNVILQWLWSNMRKYGFIHMCAQNMTKFLDIEF